MELPVDQSPWKRICTFPPWQLCSLNFNYTVCWKLFWRAHHSLKWALQAFHFHLFFPQSGAVSLGKKKQSDCCRWLLRQIVGVRTSCFVVVLEKPRLKIYLNVIRILWNVPFFSDEILWAPKLSLLQSVFLSSFMWVYYVNKWYACGLRTTDGLSLKHQCDTCRIPQCGALFVSSIFGR